MIMADDISIFWRSWGMPRCIHTPPHPTATTLCVHCIFMMEEEVPGCTLRA